MARRVIGKGIGNDGDINKLCTSVLQVTPGSIPNLHTVLALKEPLRVPENASKIVCRANIFCFVFFKYILANIFYVRKKI